MINLQSKKEKEKKFNTDFFIFIIFLLFILFLFVKNFLYLKLFFYSHSGDSALFVDVLFRVANFNSFNASSIFSSAYYYFEYLTKQPEVFCSPDYLKNTKIFNMYKASHLYFHTWILSIPIRFGFDAIKLSSLYISLCYFYSLILILYILYKKKIHFIIYILFSILLFASWKPVVDSFYGQLYFDKFFIPFMITFIFTHQNLIFEKHKFKTLYILTFFMFIIHERSALMLAGYLLSNECICKFLDYKNYRINKRYVYISLAGLLYFLFYVKYYQESYYSGNYDLQNAVYYFNEYLKFNSRTFYLTNKILLICLPLFLLSIFSFKFFIIAFGALIPNLLFSVGGAEKIGFSTHYHTYYIPFLLSSATISLINFNKNYKYKINLATQFLILTIFIFYNLSLAASDNKIIFDFKKPKLNVHLKFSINDSNTQYLLSVKEFKEDIASKIKNSNSYSVSMPEEIMPSFVKTKLRVDYFPIGIYENDFLIIKKNTRKNGTYKINFPYFLNEEKYSQIETCFSDYILNNFTEKNVIKFQNTDYFIYERN